MITGQHSGSAALAEEDGTVSAVRLRRMSAAEWRDVLAGPPGDVARYVRSAAEHGFRTAQVTWAQMLLNGHGVARDPAAALRWFGRAAALGNPEGVNMVGRCHELGWGTPVDHAEAARWFRKAADLGSDWGAYNLGCMKLYGEGLEHDPADALGWFRRSAEGGNPKAMGMVARALEEGWGVEPDPAASLAWYGRAAEAGDCWAQFNLATLLLAAGDEAAAEDWLRRSLAIGTPNYLRAAGAELSEAGQPALRELGREALASAEAAAPSAEEPSAKTGLWSGLRRLASRGAAR